MRVSEWMIVAYLGYLLALLPARPIPRASRLKLRVLAPLLIAIVLIVVGLPASPSVGAVRTWLPLPYILLCYWLTAFYFVEPQEAIEARFIAFDWRVREWLGAGSFARTAPRAILEFLEAAYFIYPDVVKTCSLLQCKNFRISQWHCCETHKTRHSERSEESITYKTSGSSGSFAFAQDDKTHSFATAPQ